MKKQQQQQINGEACLKITNKFENLQATSSLRTGNRLENFNNNNNNN